MQVTGNGDAERFHPAGYRHLRCLGWCHPASAGGLLLVFASQTRSSADLVRTITELKRQRNAVILAHYYQEDAIQDIADFIGDSLELARKAAATSADVIVFCGVHFMAETAKILNPAKRVLLPDLEAGCSLADACPADAFASFRAEHPEHIVVSYINCSAAVKAQSDLICTSSNAVDLVRQLPEDRPILFAPDQNLGRWVQAQSGRELTLWPGSCQVHVAFSEQALLQLKLEQPRAEVLAHPECQQHLLDLADFIGSTSGLLRRAEASTAQSFIVLTEPGILHQMRLKVPNKEFFEVPGADGCSCNACPYMRLNTLEKLWQCLERMEPEINMDEELRLKALAPIERMLAMSR
ncbi:quinolinate synthase NadA [Cyanobium sp. BA20m-14]|nr:quinolinate synthase NadA [Cyanobium sp. BA20m-14]